MSVESFTACLRYSIRNPEVVTIGGGEFPSRTLADVLAALDAVDDREALRLECERLRGSKERFRLESVAANEEANALKIERDTATQQADALNLELIQARKERDAAYRVRDAATGALRQCERAEVAANARLDALEALATAVGETRAFDVSAPILQAFIRIGDSDVQADADRMAATLA